MHLRSLSSFLYPLQVLSIWEHFDSGFFFIYSHKSAMSTIKYGRPATDVALIATKKEKKVEEIKIYHHYIFILT